MKHFLSPTGSSQAQNMFLPTLSLHPKAPSKQLASEQQEASTCNEDELFEHGKDGDTPEEKQTDDISTLEVSVKGMEDPKDDQSDDATIANCLGMHPV